MKALKGLAASAALSRNQVGLQVQFEMQLHSLLVVGYLGVGDVILVSI